MPLPAMLFRNSNHNPYLPLHGTHTQAAASSKQRPMEAAGGGFSRAGSPEEAAASRRAREYHECSFCKRGFTNAQALGGHMNIHRKERGSRRSASSVHGGGGAAPPPPGAAQLHAGGASGGARQYGGAADQVHLGLTLGRSEDVDLELRLWH